MIKYSKDKLDEVRDKRRKKYVDIFQSSISVAHHFVKFMMKEIT